MNYEAYDIPSSRSISKTSNFPESISHVVHGHIGSWLKRSLGHMDHGPFSNGPVLSLADAMKD